MAVEEIAIGLLSALLGALLGAFLGYRFALRAARSERLYDTKQQTYAGMFPKIQESIDILGEILELEDLNLEGDERAQGLLVRLIRPLWLLGIEGGIDEAGDQLGNFKGKKLTTDLLEDMRSVVSGWLLLEFYALIRDVRYDLSALGFAPPNPELKAKLDKVIAMVGGDETALGLRSLLRKSGLGGMLGDMDLRGRAEAYKTALGELREAMRADLALTL